ncbi:MAG: hypothetical protein GEV10_06385 [Streptosporangiales bacterium]|nr:hypothetical protein [Streptosporangiales bacterium]
MSGCRTPAYCLPRGRCLCPPGKPYVGREPAVKSRRTYISTFGMTVIDDSAEQPDTEHEENDHGDEDQS